ncbi:MAG: TetR/AcrR family transcriptional regulator [FCB group bacterium]|nr:TetR/AcrR family transcriptional regulator [FCB group bacterium]
MSIKQSPKLSAEKRREQLLSSAQKLFLKKGYRRTTVDEIAKKVGLTKGAFYFHFDNKEHIFFDLVKLVLGNYMAKTKEISSQNPSPADFLRVLFEEKGECRSDNFCYNIDFWVQAMSIPKIKRYMNNSFKKVVDNFIDGVSSSGYKNSKINLKDLAVFTFSLFDGLWIRHVVQPSIIDIPAQIELFDTLLKNNYLFKNKRGNNEK